MHCANRRKARFCASDTLGGECPPSTSFRQALNAERNAGEPSRIVAGNRIPNTEPWAELPDGSTAPGSGKSGTPCERMHSEKGTRDDMLKLPVAVARLEFEAPHAPRISATAVTATDTARNLIDSRCTRRAVTAA